MDWLNTPYVGLLLTLAGGSVMLAFVAWQRRDIGTSAIVLALHMLMIAWWSFGYAMELSAVDAESGLLWAKIEYFGIVTLPVTWFVFALYFTNRAIWLTNRNLFLCFIVPAISLLLMWTTESHGLMWRDIRLDNGTVSSLTYSYGFWFWIHSAYSYGLILLGMLLIVRTLLRLSNLFRFQAALVLFGVLTPLLVNFIYLSGLMPALTLDPTPFAFGVSGLSLAGALFRYRFLDIVPVARWAVVDVMGDGVIVLDIHNRVVDINPAAQEIFSWPAAEVVGQMAEKLFSPWPHLIEKYRHITDARDEIDLGDGLSRRYFDLRISPIHDRFQHLTGRLIVLRDMTELKQAAAASARARDQALQANELKSQLLATVSHDLRTPLGVIMGYAEMLNTEMYGPITEPQRHVLSEVTDHTRYLSNLIETLLDQAQLESGQLNLEVEPFSPRDLLQSIESKVAGLLKRNQLQLHTAIAPDLPRILLGDAGRLQQILLNLVGNAVKFTEEGQVEIALFKFDATHWAIRVADTGIGIPVEAQRYIFEPFRQVNNTSKRRHSGNGLGLSIVNQLVILMKGQIMLDSEPGRGSTFTVVLPLAVLDEAMFDEKT